MLASGVSDHFVSGASLVIDGRVVAAINEEPIVWPPHDAIRAF